VYVFAHVPEPAPVEVAVGSDEPGGAYAVYRLLADGTLSPVTTFEVTADRLVETLELDGPGTYLVEEVGAPAGLARNARLLALTVDADLEVSASTYVRGEGGAPTVEDASAWTGGSRTDDGVYVFAHGTASAAQAEPAAPAAEQPAAAEQPKAAEAPAAAAEQQPAAIVKTADASSAAPAALLACGAAALLAGFASLLARAARRRG
jgi:hypothetical protein